MNYTVEWLKKSGIPLTIENFLSLEYMGSVKSLRELEEDYPEDFAEVMDLIVSGILVDGNIVDPENGWYN